MTPEEIRAELEAARDSDALTSRIRDAKGLPAPLGKLLETVALEKQGLGRQVLKEQALLNLAPLGQGTWLRVAEVLCPKLIGSFDAGWEALARRPFQDGEYRRPFRFAGKSTDVAVARWVWLLGLGVELGSYDCDIEWIATRSEWLAGWDFITDLGWLLAAEIDRGARSSGRVLETLTAAVNGEHPIARASRTAVQALLASSRPEGWEVVEKLLLAAQRQEGVRQTILESVDEAHPEAFRRMLRLILEHDLERFSSVVRAVDVWLGFAWDGSSRWAVRSVLERVLRFLEDPAARDQAIADGDAETVFLALWSTGFEDVEAAAKLAIPRLEHTDLEQRFVALHLLLQTRLLSPRKHFIGCLSDDLRVATLAATGFLQSCEPVVDSARVFPALEKLMGRMTMRKQRLEPLVWPWMALESGKELVAQAMSAQSRGVPLERMRQHVRELDAAQREEYLRRLVGLDRGQWTGWRFNPGIARKEPLQGSEYELDLELLGDASPSVRSVAFDALQNTEVTEVEIERLIELSSRKVGDLRQAILQRLSRASSKLQQEAAERLLNDRQAQRRLVGLELLRAVEEKGQGDWVGPAAERYLAAQESISDVETAHLEAIARPDESPPSQDDGLGLLAQGDLPSFAELRVLEPRIDTPAAIACVDDLARLLFENREREVDAAWFGKRLLLDLWWGHSAPVPAARASDDSVPLPLEELWRQWESERTSRLRDTDGLELVRARMATRSDRHWSREHATELRRFTRHLEGPIHTILSWCLVWNPPNGLFDQLLDGLESCLAEIEGYDRKDLTEEDDSPFRYGEDDEKPPVRLGVERARAWIDLTRQCRELLPDHFRAEHARRLFDLLGRLVSQGIRMSFAAISLEELLAANRAGLSDEEAASALIALSIGPWRYGWNILETITRLHASSSLGGLTSTVERIRRRIVEIESTRGERATAASRAALAVKWSGGLEALSVLVPALGKSKLARSFWSWSEDPGRQLCLSYLIARSAPRPEDTPEAFTEWARSAKVPESRLVELASYAPQWASHVEAVLEWPGLESGVWWLQAHTKEEHWGRDDLRDSWASAISERTPLTAQELQEGAVDVAWFREALGELGAERWKKLEAAAKYGSSNAGHKRAMLFASAMRGDITRDALLERIDQKRHQDSARALGLLPLAGGKSREGDVLARYTRLQSFRHESRKFGAQRQAGEGRAVDIGLENLARTAGYRDPLRLQWAMERQALGDLAKGPIVCAKDEVTLTLSLDESGSPALTVEKKGKALKSVPAKLRKDPEVVELRARIRELRQQASRVKGSLEQAMCRGDTFEGTELFTLFEHPILAKSLERLVFLGEGMIGTPKEGGRLLEDPEGHQEPVGRRDILRIAHPLDLLERGDWPAWQRDCFRSERVQPFKQIFREVYPFTEAERASGQDSKRYAGHQVNPRHALALLGGRGWVARPGEGILKTFHEAGITAHLELQESFWSPADVEGLTLESVLFSEKGRWKPIDLTDVPPRLFSETMRDLDLVVSVAHQGGVDPESSASTVEMRARLLEETTRLLGLKNVQVKKHHAIIRGELAEYSVHLGSAMARLSGGVALWIVAVHSQHRGRLFLPFADDDPKTAEVLSKVLLLARDQDIRDPSILEQIRGR